MKPNLIGMQWSEFWHGEEQVNLLWTALFDHWRAKSEGKEPTAEITYHAEDDYYSFNLQVNPWNCWSGKFRLELHSVKTHLVILESYSTRTGYGVPKVDQTQE